MLRLRQRELLFRARFARLTKVGVFCCILLEREGVLFRARFARLSKVVVFCGTFGCTGKGHVVRETSPASLERGGRFSGLALLAYEKWWFSVALLGAPVRGM